MLKRLYRPFDQLKEKTISTPNTVLHHIVELDNVQYIQTNMICTARSSQVSSKTRYGMRLFPKTVGASLN